MKLLSKREFLNLSFDEKRDYVKVRMVELSSSFDKKWQRERAISRELDIPPSTVNNYVYFSKSKRIITMDKMYLLKHDLRKGILLQGSFRSKFNFIDWGSESIDEGSLDMFLDSIFNKLKQGGL